MNITTNIWPFSLNEWHRWGHPRRRHGYSQKPVTVMVMDVAKLQLTQL